MSVYVCMCVCVFVCLCVCVFALFLLFFPSIGSEGHDESDSVASRVVQFPRKSGGCRGGSSPRALHEAEANPNRFRTLGSHRLHGRHFVALLLAATKDTQTQSELDASRASRLNPRVLQ